MKLNNPIHVKIYTIFVAYSLLKKLILPAHEKISGLHLHTPPRIRTLRTTKRCDLSEWIDSLAFSNGKAIFSITGFAGLSTAQVGEGSYEELNHYLLVNTTEYSGEKSTYQATESSLKDSCKVKVVATNNYALPKILIEALTQSDKLIASKITGDDGGYVSTQPKDWKIKISALGYDPLTIPYTADWSIW